MAERSRLSPESDEFETVEFLDRRTAYEPVIELQETESIDSKTRTKQFLSRWSTKSSKSNRSSRSTAYGRFSMGSNESAVNKPDEQSLFIMSLLYLSLVIPPILLVAWYMFVYERLDLELTRSAPIGGQLDQIVAKGIDVLCSAILAPLGMAILNLLWFRLAKIAVCNEDQSAVSLKAILEVSVTHGATFDPWKLWALFRTSRHRFTLFAFLTLLSAASTSMFVNVIAYEAISVPQAFPHTSNWTLHYLSQSNFNGSEPDCERFSDDQSMRLNLDFISAMYRIYYGLSDSASGQSWQRTEEYINKNVTSTDLEKAPEHFTELWDVPAYRLGLDCEPANITSFKFNFNNGPVANDESSSSQSTIDVVISNKDRPSIYSSKIETSKSRLDTLYGARFYYALQNSDNVLLGVYELLSSLILSNITENYAIPTIPPQPSPFGPIHTFTQPNTTRLTLGRSTLGRSHQTYALICSLTRQHGHVNLTESKSATARQWDTSHSSFSGTLTPATNFLQQVWSQPKFNSYRPPLGSTSQFYINPIGHALGSRAGTSENYFKIDEEVIFQNYTGSSSSSGPDFKSNPVNFTTYARNFLYAAGSMESSIWTIAHSDLDQKTIRPETSYHVPGFGTTLKYRMSYIPGLLLAGLVTLTLSAAIVFGMTWYSLGTVSASTDRVVDGLRFVADFAEAIRREERDEGGGVIEGANRWGRRELERFGERLSLQYYVDGGALRLRRRGGDGVGSGEGARPLLGDEASAEDGSLRDVKRKYDLGERDYEKEGGFDVISYR